MQGTPGIFRIRPRSSLSQVATMKHLHWVTMFVRQSSAYPFFLQLQGIRSNLGSFANLSAILYLPPSFSSSAMTQSVTQGMHFAKRQSIMDRTISSFFLEAVRMFERVRQSHRYLTKTASPPKKNDH